MVASDLLANRNLARPSSIGQASGSHDVIRNDVIVEELVADIAMIGAHRFEQVLFGADDGAIVD